MFYTYTGSFPSPSLQQRAAATIPAHSDGVEHMRARRLRDPFKIKEENKKFRGL
jgi:hypothetical protein